MFIGPSLVLLAVPGPLVVYIIARAVAQGRIVGVVSVLGIQAGDALYLSTAALGLTAVLGSWPLMLAFVKYAGAMYLIGLGVWTFAAQKNRMLLSAEHEQRLFKVFIQGTVVSISNPHTALFYIVFLPAFITPQAGSATPQVVMLGLIFIGLRFLVQGGYALLAGSVGTRVRHNLHLLRFQPWVSGGVYVIIGINVVVNGPV